MADKQVSLSLKRTKTEVEIRELVHQASHSQQIDLAIVTIGNTGTGKSTLLNTLAGKDVFQGAGGIMGCTKKVHKEIVERQTRTIALIDTPGLLDPKILDEALAQGAKYHVLLSQQTAKFEAYLEEALHQAGEKVDAFLLVFNVKSRWSVEAQWVIEILNTLGIDYQHMIAVFTHGESYGKTKEERRKKMEAQLRDTRSQVCKLKDLLENVKFRWIITESDDVKSSGNSETWEEVSEKLRSVKPMQNEDFIEIQHKMEAEEEIGRIKNATLEEIKQQEGQLREIAELECKIKQCEPEKLKLTQELEKQVEKLTMDVPEAVLTAEDDLASFLAKHNEMLLAVQEKKKHLQSLQSEYAALKEELGSRHSEEETRSRQQRNEANEALLQRAREYWPQYMNGGEHVPEGDERNEKHDGHARDEDDVSGSETLSDSEAHSGENDELLS